jgi:hypothetical protein
MEFINKHIYDNLTSRRNHKIISSCNFSDRFWLTYLGARNSYPIQQFNPSVNLISAGSPLPFIRISKHNRASSQGIKVTFSADTGAARTVISSKLFRIPNSKKPRLERSSASASVNGQPLTEMGKAVINITLGNLTLNSEYKI